MVSQKTFKNTPRTLGPSVTRGTEGHQNSFYAKIATRMLRACYAHGLGSNPERPAAHGRALCMSPVANRYALVCCLLYTNLPLCAICGPWMCPVAHGCTVVCRLQLINMPLYVVCGIQLCPCTSCTAHRYALVRHLWHMTLPTSALVRCLRLIDMPLHAVGPAAQYV
jgi:hypothetical protein